MKDLVFKLGMVFANAKVFSVAVRQHVIKHQRGVVIKKNLGKKVKFVCIPLYT